MRMLGGLVAGLGGVVVVVVGLVGRLTSGSRRLWRFRLRGGGCIRGRRL